MRALIEQIGVPVHLLWLSNRAPGDEPADGFGADPLFVTEAMLEAVRGHAASCTIAIPPPSAARSPVGGMSFSPQEEAAARLMPTPEVHRLAARDLVERIRATA